MTPTALKALIESIPAAKTLADAGRDADVLPVIAPHLPLVPVPGQRRKLIDVLGAFPDPAHGADVIARLKTAATVNPVLAIVLPELEQGGPGLDFADPRTHQVLDALTAATVLTSAEASLLKSLGSQPDRVTVDQISAAWSEFRPGGQIQ